MWHKRFGHVSTTVLRQLLPINVELIVDKMNKYAACPCAKQIRLPFPASSIKYIDCFDLVHMDLWGPCIIATYDGNKYFLIVVDDYSRMRWVFLIKLKSDVCVIIQQFITFVKTQFDKVIRVIKTDNGTEFVNSVCSSLFQ